MNGIGIAEIGLYAPEQGEDIILAKDRWGLQESFIRDKAGFTRVARKAPDMETSDLAVSAYRALAKKTGLAESDVECLVVCTQNPDGHGLPHTSAAVHAKLRLPERCAVFDVSLGCSGYVYGLSIVSSFMAANGLSRGVFITADPYSKIIEPDDRDTAILFGDGAAATLLTDRAPRWTIGPALFASIGEDRGAIEVRENGRLSMNGRAVFSFAATKVPEMVRQLLGQNGLTLKDVDLFLLHQGSKFIVRTIGERLGLPAEKVPFAAGELGNTVSSSIPFLLAGVDPERSKRLLLSGFGVGLSNAAMLLHAREV